MVAVRTIAGVIVSVVGLMLLFYAGLDFNRLFFVQKTFTQAYVPVYNRLVVVPAFLGMLILLDGSFILGLKRVFSLSVHVLGNLVWLLALYQLNQNLAIPTLEISAYQQIFYLILAGVLFFIVGIIVNDISQHNS